MKKVISALSLIFLMAAPYASAGDGAVRGRVKVITTTDARSKDLAVTDIRLQKGRPSGENVVTLLPKQTFQTMDGFGVAITGSTCYNLMRMTEANRETFLRETFSDGGDGFGFSYVRVAIGCSDFSLSEYTCCDTKGMENFSLTEEENRFVIPILKKILEINPDLKIMGTPWTPPRWMKTNGNWTSGELKPECYADYAEYFVRWIKAFAEEGINVYSVTPQNEPLNRGNSASCYMPWDQERDFVKVLGPALRRAGLKTKIFAFDHNYNYDNMESQRGYPTKIYEDPEAAGHLAGAAYHNYGGNKEELTLVHNAAPGKDLVFTETSIGTWNNGRSLEARLVKDMEDVALGTVNRWCTGVIVWNLMLDHERGPHRGPGACATCYGAVDLNTDYTIMQRNSHYYIIAHMSSVVDPGAVRIATAGYTAEGLTYSAFRNPDGSYAFVLSNGNGNAVSFDVADGKRHFRAEVPPRSAVSYRWKK